MSEGAICTLAILTELLKGEIINDIDNFVKEVKVEMDKVNKKEKALINEGFKVANETCKEYSDTFIKLRKEKAVAYFDSVCDYYKAELSRNKDVLTSYNPLNITI